MGSQMVKRSVSVPKPAILSPKGRGRDLRLVHRIHDVADRLGMPLLAWQTQAVDHLARFTSGRPTYGDALISVGRQSGKTILAKLWITAWAEEFPGSQMVLIAQKGEDARKRFGELGDLLLHSMNYRTPEIRRGIGAERIVWPNGSRLWVSAPTVTAIHGSSLDLVICDEVWALEDEILGGIIPARSARPASQMLMISTAGIRGQSEVMEKFRTLGIEGRDVGVAEWSCPDDLDPLDEANWHRFMVAYNEPFFDVRGVKRARETLSAHAFRRYYGNQWVDAVEEIIDPATWERVQDPNLLKPTEGTIAVDVSATPMSVSIAAAWKLPDGSMASEVVLHAPGSGASWVPERVMQIASQMRVRKIISTSGSPAAAIEADLEAAARRLGAVWRRMTLPDLSAASMRLEEAIRLNEISIAPHDGLDLAIRTASRKVHGDSWRFVRRRDVDSSPLIAMATAVLGQIELDHQRVVPQAF